MKKFAQIAHLGLNAASEFLEKADKKAEKAAEKAELEARRRARSKR